MYTDITYHVRKAFQKSCGIYQFIIGKQKFQINMIEFYDDKFTEETLDKYPEYKTLAELEYLEKLEDEEQKRIQLCRKLKYCSICGKSYKDGPKCEHSNSRRLNRL